jgi:hypothetical protein|tara:strand:- start:1669 stop:1845 length:177 start_codon:yes stop_codon:yes gene_type:complete
MLPAAHGVPARFVLAFGGRYERGEPSDGRHIWFAPKLVLAALFTDKKEEAALTLFFFF